MQTSTSSNIQTPLVELINTGEGYGPFITVHVQAYLKTNRILFQIRPKTKKDESVLSYCTNDQVCLKEDVEDNLNGLVRSIEYRPGFGIQELYEGEMKRGRPSGFGRFIKVGYFEMFIG